METEKKEKRLLSINPFLILFIVIIICAIASWIIIPGAFDRVTEDGRTTVVPGTYHSVERTPVRFLDLFRSIPEGMVGSASIMFLVMIIGGTIEVYNQSGTLDRGIAKILDASKKTGSTFMLILIMVIFTLIGGFLGWAEQIIPFIPIIVSISLALGYDSLVGMAISAFICLIGFSISPTNVYTVGISHGIAELPMFSGMGYRLIWLVIFAVVCMAYILIYANKIKKDPSKSLVAGIDVSDLRKDYSNLSKMTTNQVLALVALVVAFSIAIFGVLNWGWAMNELSAIFLIVGIACGIICRMKPDVITNALVKGVQASVGGALVIGIARAMQIVMTNGGLVDPIINTLSRPLEAMGGFGAALGMFFVILFFDLLVTSGSAKALALMPILIPLADLSGITRQTAVLIYQLGDGISNTFWPTMGTFLIFLSLAKVPLGKWYKFIIPLEIILLVLSAVSILIAVMIGYGPF